MPYLSEIIPQVDQIQKLTEILGIEGYIALDERNIINFLFHRDQATITMKIIDAFMTISHIDTPCDSEEEMQFHLYQFKTNIERKNNKLNGQTKLSKFF